MRTHRVRALPIVSAALFASACSIFSMETFDDPPAGEDGVSRSLDESVAQAGQRAGAVPEGVAEELLPGLELVPRGGGRVEQRFDVTVKDVAAREFFVGLVEGTPHNVVIDPGIQGEISLALKNVTLDEVMTAVRDAYGYQITRTDYGYQVRRSGVQTRVFHIDYLNVHRIGSSQTRISSGQVTQGSNAPVMYGGTVATNMDGGSTSGSRVSTDTDADFWLELTESLQLIVGSGSGRNVVASPNTGIVIVRAPPEELRAVQDYLARAQLSLGRQVILEAKILEVALSDKFQSGISWAQLAEPRGTLDILSGVTGGGTILDTGLSEIVGNTGVLNPDTLTQVASTETSAFGGVFTMAISSDDFAAFIELLEAQGTVRTLSSPRVSTVNNQKAVIKVGTDEFFVTDISTTTVTGTASVTTPDVTLTPFFSGIALDVTPQIAEDGAITLHIHPAISQVDDQTKTVTFGEDEEVVLPLALSTIRESDSVVRAQSGQVIVIGGLMQDNADHRRAYTPWIGRIPFIGFLFGHRLDRLQKTELVILLRAVVVRGDTFANELEKAKARIDQLHRGRPPAAPPAAPQAAP